MKIAAFIVLVAALVAVVKIIWQDFKEPFYFEDY